MGTMQRVRDREYVKNAREPAKFNAMTYAKEYGKVLRWTTDKVKYVYELYI